MRALIGAELLKLRTTRGWIVFVAALVLLAGIGAAGQVGSAQVVELGTRHFQRDLLHPASVAAALIGLLVGITSVTTEWRHGTITRTFLVTPRRGLVLAAKGASAFLYGLVLAILAVGVVLAVAIPWIAIDGASFELGGVSGLIARIVLAAALWGVLGMTFGALVQSQTVALVAAVVWFLLAEALFALLLRLLGLDGVADYLPAAALRALDSTFEGGLSPAAGGAVVVAYLVGVGALGYLRVARRDIT